MKNGKQGEGGGRKPVVLDETQVAQLEALAAVLSKAQVADYYDISENTLRAIEERQPEVSAAYKRGKSKAIATVATGLLQQARNGHTSAAMFYLKCQAGWSEVAVEQRDIPPMQVILTHDTDSASE